MVQSLKLGGTPAGAAGKTSIRRLNRLPIIAAIVLVVLFLGVIFYGLTSRRLIFRETADVASSGGSPATTFADQLKRGVTDGIIGEPAPQPVLMAPQVEQREEPRNPFMIPARTADQPRPIELEPEEVWRTRLRREQEEQYLRELQRQQMARLQASNVAYDAPLAINTDKLKAATTDPARSTPTSPTPTTDLYSAALQAGLNGQAADPNGQNGKASFFNSDLAKLGYLPNQVVSQRSPYELKRGSVIPATLITGINSDLPGRITAQVSQNVHDSATGHRLLIPQGTRLMGRYDSKVSFGQSRILVIWTDIIFPNGATLQIGSMAGTDATGYGGFRDKVDNHHLRTFGSAILLAVIGAGMDLAVPSNPSPFNSNSPQDAARINFARTFGQVAERTISKNLDVQPTLEIRPGYQFNILVDQDIVFPGAYRS